MGKQSTLLGFFAKNSGPAPQTQPAQRSAAAAATTPARQTNKQTLASKEGAVKPPKSSSASKVTSASGKLPPSENSIPDTPPSITNRPTRSSPRLNKTKNAPPSPPPSSPLAKRKRKEVVDGSHASSFSKPTSPTEPNRDSTSPVASSAAKQARQTFQPPAPERSIESACTSLGDEDDEDDEDERVATGSRRTRKRPMNYAESGESGTDSDASDNFKPLPKAKGKSKVAELATKRRKKNGRSSDDDEDYEMRDASSDEDGPISVADSDEDAGSASDAPDSPAKKPKVKTKAATTSVKEDVASPRPVARTVTQSGSSSSFFTNAERRAEEAKAEKKSSEQPFSFLLDPRDKDKNRPGDPDYDPRTLYIPNSAWNSFSPFEVQFWKIKQNHFDTVLFFQKGKFYELYEDDALIGHREFDLKLTDRVKMKMVGVPESSFELFAAKFLALGYKVGRVDQAETAVAKGMRTGKKNKGGDSGIVNRELRHVLTSGTIVEPSALQDDMNTYCISIKEQIADYDAGADTPTIGICTLDAATAEFRLAHFIDDATRGKLETLLRSLRIKELLYEKGCMSQATLRMIRNCVTQSCKITMLKPAVEFLTAEAAQQRVDELFEDPSQVPEAISSMATYGEAMAALGAMLYYLGTLQLDKDLCSSRNFDIYDTIKKNECLALDAQSLAHLNVLSNEQGNEEGTLFRLLNRCQTPFGKRLFKIWLVSPLTKIDAINARLDAVEDISQDDEFRSAFSDFASKLPDIERIIPRIYAGKCKPREFLAVLSALKLFDKGMRGLKAKADNHRTGAVSSLFKSIPSIKSLVQEVQSKFEINGDDQSFVPASGVHAEFDKAEKALNKIEDQLNEELTEITKNLNLNKNKIQFKHMGTKDIYQIEVPRATKVPANWILVSQTKDVHRHYSPAVRKLVQELKEARETRLAALRCFSLILFQAFCTHAPVFLKAVKAVAELDCLISLSEASRSMGEPVCRPTFVESSSASIEFQELRHPCIAGTLSTTEFIPNDIALGVEKSEEIMILTGGNMAGKSTTARTAATAVIIAQIGCMVPAQSATISPVDRIASRMGANDQIFRNNSTFMVEMLEASRILKESTPRSLVIMDELGRGTSTFDGHAIAYAVLHHLISRTRCIGFFLTHYTSLALEFDSYLRVANRHMQVQVDDQLQDVIFTYKLVPGIAESSYGTQVAALAGIPREICDRAQAVALEFAQDSKAKQAKRMQSRISVATLADFEFLLEVAVTVAGEGDEKEGGGDGAAIIAAQLDIVRGQVSNLQRNDKARLDVDEGKGEASPLPSSSQPASEKDSLLARDEETDQRESSPASSIPPAEPRAKLQEVQNDAATELEFRPHAESPPAEAATSEPTVSVPTPAQQKQQMVLDFGQRRSVTCGQCNMSYDSSSPEDAKMHSWHHARVVDGIVWTGKALSGAEEADDNVLTLTIKDQEGRKRLQALKPVSGSTASSPFDSDDEVVVLMYSLASFSPPSASRADSRKSSTTTIPNTVISTSATNKSSNGAGGAQRNTKMHEVLSTVDEALGAVALPLEMLRSCKLFIARCRGRAVGACLVGRVKPGAAREVLPLRQDRAATAGADVGDESDDAVFYDGDNGDGDTPSAAATATSVSDGKPRATLSPSIGIHRIWVMRSLRRLGIGALLLDAALGKSCYGLDAHAVLELHGGARAQAVAFSQPTAAGRRLAERWIRSGRGAAHRQEEQGKEPRLLVFKED
ncbi:hypothetical protein K437DRAFT_296514 [Tilletiaria anomala UBC 951]|uniref:DNA mismatch repair proteins mutS family domain-containing protein n=1 Tax=Tilletiaria anomala (strain ATCC 24038 / CBS 436.72 / UBC 951) TaxID=1037660 RepID=A0A066VFY6_TILAU|nr:uncharacterized protein K437DRAFT_296514 [Tilletiaria anomala UBC 951]KDN37684.1 hypothetical protein K437DRAFT_296514 [Tilletiaria anomala UBC 951]